MEILMICLVIFIESETNFKCPPICSARFPDLKKYLQKSLVAGYSGLIPKV